MRLNDLLYLCFPAMKKYLLIWMCLPFLAIAQQNAVKGFCVDNDRAYFYVNKTLYCQDIKTGEVLMHSNPASDTALIEGLSLRVMKVLQITEAAEMDTARERIRNFYVLNVSVYAHQVYLGVRFKVISKTHTNLYYALITLDNHLKSKDYFFLSGVKLFSMQPFHALQFKDTNTVCMPAVNNENKSKPIMGYYDFTMNSKNHSLLRSRKIVAGLVVYTLMSVMNNIILDPVIYSVPASNGALFYRHPYAVLYDSSGKLLCDPYQFENKIRTIDEQSRRSSSMIVYNEHPAFYGAFKTYSNIVLASVQAGQFVFMAVSNADENKTDIVKYDAANGKYTITTVDIAIKDTYFVFSGKTLFYLDCRSGEPLIKSLEVAGL